MQRVSRIYGVDFSGAALAGQNAWVASFDLDRAKRLTLVELRSLEALAGTAERGPALAHLVARIRASEDALWGIDFPFGLPIELGWKTWSEQLDAVKTWTGTANAFGLECVRRCQEALGYLHVRRTTDTETRTPFDCYHYRIVHQMFHGMRDVVGPLALDDKSCIVPFQMERLRDASRVIVEACPSSTLKRWGAPHTRYKQPQGTLEEKHRKTRAAILRAIKQRTAISPSDVRTMNANPGGDAFDAVIAGIGTWEAFNALNVDAIATHPRYRLEGLVMA
jgi:hypothetical protein